MNQSYLHFSLYNYLTLADDKNIVNGQKYIVVISAL